jgi:hypothetical protein
MYINHSWGGKFCIKYFSAWAINDILGSYGVCHQKINSKLNLITF